MKKAVFEGACTALVTPFSDGGIDLHAMQNLIDWQLAEGSDALVFCGTTGEASTMTESELQETFEFAAAYIDGRIPVIAGTGSNSTAHALARSKMAEQAGADALLVVSPYYNKATEEGLVRHYFAIADAVSIPVIVYNVPSRTGVNMPLSVYERLSRHPNINGVKEASGDLGKVSSTLGLLGEDFHVWSGNDDQNVPILSLGGKGVISVLSNVCPRYVKRMTDACRSEHYKEAAKMQNRIMPLIRALFCEVNPIPVKEALQMLGFDVGGFRLPLCEMREENRAKLREALKLLA